MGDTNARDKWNTIYSTHDVEITQPKPAEILSEHECLLPKKGIALDLASGLGANAVFLAERGLTTYAWDISSQAIDRLKEYCDRHLISVITQIRDVEQYPPEKNSFDVICISYYLERTLIPEIIAALKPNGLLFYQTFIRESVTDTGPKNLAYRLKQNELLSLFSSLHTLFYQEYGRVGNLENGLRDVAMLVAQKR